MRLGIVVATVVMALALTSCGVTGSLSLMNRASDGSVLAGLMTVSFIFAAWVWLIVSVKKKLFKEGSFEMTEAGKAWLKNLFLIALIVMGPTLSGCLTRVEPGHVGIKVNYAGSDRGVEDCPQVTGWVFYNPMTTKVLDFPVFVQTATWCAAPHEGSHLNEEMSFNSKEGMVMTADISLSYRLEPKKVPHFYVKYRTDDLNAFTHGILRNFCRDSFNEVASRYAVEEIYGHKKEEVLLAVKEKISASVKEIGLIIEQFGYMGSVRPPQNVIEALNLKVAATQKAIQIENEIRQSRAEAEKKVALANGDAQVQLAKAKADSESKLMQAQADAKSNELLAKSLSPELVRYKQIQVLEKWDGKRPMVEGGSSSGFIFQLPLPPEQPAVKEAK